MGLGHVPQEPVRAEGEGADVQRRQRRGAATAGRPVDLTRVARGQWGEELAARWYVRNGFEILDRNWRCAGGEIDIVAGRGPQVVFVEVKARSSERFGSAASAVDERKQQRIRLAAQRWLGAHPGPYREVRFDVVAITGTTLEVVTAAF